MGPTANSTAARGVNHTTMASGNDNESNDGGLPKLPAERKWQNSGVLWELMRVPSTANSSGAGFWLIAMAAISVCVCC